MNYLLAVVFGMVWICLLIWNKPLSDKFGKFYARRFASTFGGLAHFLGWDNPDKPFNRFLYRGVVVALAVILLIFAIAALTGTNFVGPSGQEPDYFLQRSH